MKSHLFFASNASLFVLQYPSQQLIITVIVVKLCRRAKFFCAVKCPFCSSLKNKRKEKTDEDKKEKKKGGKAEKKSSLLSSLSDRLIKIRRRRRRRRREYYTYIQNNNKKMTREDDLYRALGLERTASQEEIRKAYKTTGNE